MRSSILLLALAGCVASAPTRAVDTPVSQPPPISPPVAKREPKAEVLHGEKRVDDYFWLRNKGAPDVVTYLNAENAYTDAFMKPTQTFQEHLYEEMLARIQETDVTAPYPDGNWLYFLSTAEGPQAVWSQRLDRATKRPVGEPTLVYRPQADRLQIFSGAEFGPGQGRDRLIFPMSESFGNIWMAE